ncbi:MAG: methionine biosynthesis protein MetW [bacterium]|nr:methionine biosynthesis protein MetW [bacterium]
MTTNNLHYFHKMIYNLIPEKSRVLDLGCGDGALLAALSTGKNTKGYGVEIDIANVKVCVANGLSVYQGNLIEALREFGTKRFDVVILSQTLQEVYDPIPVLEEMLRVGKKVIVTFPNFGHWKVRLQLLLSGSSPRTKQLPYEWYNTPNIRVITINDFRSLCKAHHIRVLDQAPLIKPKWLQILIKPFSNLVSKKGLFILQR